MGKKPKKKQTTPGELLVCSNSKALVRFSVEERFEAGMVLVGSEVKSLRAKQGDLDGAFAGLRNGELYLHKMYIGPYANAAAYGHEMRRSRKLLAHRHEIERLTGKLAMRGYTLLPTRVYFRNGRAKVELGLCKAKDMEDKRHELRSKVELREAKAAIQRRRQ